MVFKKKATATATAPVKTAAKTGTVAERMAAGRAKAKAEKLAAGSGGKPAAKGTKAGAAKTGRVKPPTFQSPSDFKPCFIELMVKTQEDGLLGPKFRATRVQGNWTNENAKRFDMMEYDAPTVTALIARLSAKTFATNVARRLPASTAFRIVIRVGKRAADDSLMCGVKSISKQVVSAKTGKSRWSELEDTTDPVRRKIRGAARLMVGAFTDIQLPPSKRKSKDTDEE